MHEHHASVHGILLAYTSCSSHTWLLLLSVQQLHQPDAVCIHFVAGPGYLLSPFLSPIPRVSPLPSVSLPWLLKVSLSPAGPTWDPLLPSSTSKKGCVLASSFDFLPESLPSLGFLGPVGRIGDHNILDHICLHAMHLLLCLNIYLFTHFEAVHAPLISPSHLNVQLLWPHQRMGMTFGLAQKKSTSELHFFHAHCETAWATECSTICFLGPKALDTSAMSSWQVSNTHCQQYSRYCFD